MARRRKSRRQESTSTSLSQVLVTYQKYGYTPLSSPTTDIRLLRLHPAPDTSWPLEASIFHTSLSSSPPYTALSYTWGEQVSSSLILIDGDHVSITSNLKHAMERLRQTDREVLMWIDALCINQDDVVERSIQTTRMRSVYVRAESVAVWLGLVYRYSQGAIKLVRELNSCSTVEEIRAVVVNPERREKLEALVALFRRQYWWRIWVIQEVASASVATVYIGHESISWTELNNACSVLRQVETDLHSQFYTNPSWVRTLTHGGPRGLQLSRYSPSTASPPLLELLLTHKSKKSTDPKDKVFALVGISASRESFGDLDYALSVTDIFTHTARHIIESTRKLDVICVKQHDAPRYDLLPSWAPDWTRPKAGAGATILGLHHRVPAFAAAGDTDAEVEFRDSKAEGGLILRTRGVVLGTISAVGRRYRKHGAPSHVLPALDAFHDWWSLFFSSVAAISTSESNHPSTADQARFAHLISCGHWSSHTEEQLVEKIDAIFALSDEKLNFSEFSIERLDASSRTSTDTMASSTSSVRDQEEDEELTGTDEEKEQMSAMIAAGMMMNRRRMFVIADAGIVGLAPWNANAGDEVAVLFGCKFPVVVRRGVAAGGKDILIGEAYIEGFMEGEAIKGLQDGLFAVGEFELS